ncbi:MAG TPA: DUF2332 domain-containing protein [Lacipirellulaceae bacterium]|nr:DUF2332 domain-containing protein [Lacipirellulaceae bacterium]HWB49203.1 DUF2332 domain-containing protein [Stellaceae bacterium]
MTGDVLSRLSALYRRFADEEFRGRSPLYEAISHGVADNRETLSFLATLPPDKWQPNLLLASVRHVCGLATGWPDFRENLLANLDAVRSVVLTHSTQTNEPARCATLLPVLAQLPQPLALIEVGASAGLCLLPDFYAYDYAGHIIRPDTVGSSPPVFACAINAATPIPTSLPKIVWRAGLDLNPLDASDSVQADWLATLVWPEQTQRRANLRKALKIAAACRPRIEHGDLRGDGLAHLCADAPQDATLVIFHTAVLAYIPERSEREAFGERAMALCDYWVSNENPRLLPQIAGRAGEASMPGQYLLSVNGSPVAWTDPHGTTLEWLGARN